LWYGGPNAAANAVHYAKFFSRSHAAVIRVFDEACNVIETNEQVGDFKEWGALAFAAQLARNGICETSEDSRRTTANRNG